MLFIANWHTGVMYYMMCPVHRKPSLAWRFESVDLERLSSRLWAPAVSQKRQKSTNKTEEKDEGTVEMWTCGLKVQLSLLLLLNPCIYFFSFACSVSLLPYVAVPSSGQIPQSNTVMTGCCCRATRHKESSHNSSDTLYSTHQLY